MNHSKPPVFSLLAALLVPIVALIAWAGPASARDWSSLRIGVDATYKPFTYKTPDGKLAGFDVDIANALCAQMKAKCSFVESSWEGIIPGLRAHKFDAIISSMSITDDRKKAVAFSDKYYQTPTVVIARAGGSIDGSPASLKGKRVGVLKASIQEKYAQGELAPAGATVIGYDSTQQSYLDLKSGRLDAVVVDKFEGRGGFLDTPDGKGYSIVGPDLSDEKYFGSGAGIAVRKEDTDLRDRFNAALKVVRANGTWKKIADKYFTFDIYGK